MKTVQIKELLDINLREYFDALESKNIQELANMVGSYFDLPEERLEKLLIKTAYYILEERRLVTFSSSPSGFSSTSFEDFSPISFRISGKNLTSREYIIRLKKDGYITGDPLVFKDDTIVVEVLQGM